MLAVGTKSVRLNFSFCSSCGLGLLFPRPLCRTFAFICRVVHRVIAILASSSFWHNASEGSYAERRALKPTR
jgi:hypothetical protein